MEIVEAHGNSVNLKKFVYRHSWKYMENSRSYGFFQKIEENMESDRSLWNNCNLWKFMEIYGHLKKFWICMDIHGN